MPEVTIQIGGRGFDVACQEGEEHYLQAAAKMLNDEAEALVSQVGRMPDARMLLMAGLMLADKTASMEDKVAEIQAKLDERDAEVSSLRDAGPERVEVAVVPKTVTDAMAELSARAEALAAQIEEQASA